MEDLNNVIKDGDYYYYNSIVRPGQILKTTETISDVEILPVGSTYSEQLLITNHWGSANEDADGNIIYSEIIQHFNSMFN